VDRAPSLKVHYEISNRKGEVQRQYDDDEGRSYSIQGQDRLVVARKLPLMGLPPGEYNLKVMVKDEVAGIEKSATADFRVVG
jgi:hypothetical protein